MPKTTTVLTIELPVELSDRLRDAMRSGIGRSLRDVTIEALEEWLDRRQSEDSSVADQTFRAPADRLR